MDGVEAQCSGGLDIGEAVVDENGVMRFDVETVEGEVKDGGVGFDEFFFAGDDDALELLEEVKVFACVGKGLCRPVGEGVESEVGVVFQVVEDGNSAFDGAAEHLVPTVVEGTDLGFVVRVLADE